MPIIQTRDDALSETILMKLKLTHEECMELAIHMAEQCRPDNKAKTPHVGAVIALDSSFPKKLHYK